MSGRHVADQSHLYRFKAITTVPTAKDLIDVCLSRTQRKTPTQVHPQFAIGRIRDFYMRKVKFCQQTFHDKLTTILDDFPRLDDIHPFYSNLLNVLYDKDHYKLALGQVNAVRGVIDTIGKEYVKLLKFADSAYKCKMLKRAALGRMCTACKKLSKVMAYLEEVRQHMSRLPGINPYARTILLAGHPNVGKSTFMNALSHANVEVEPFPFTTKAPHVGHFDYDYQTWQIVDTPGILDRPLVSRNSIEMTAITALAYLNCAILFLIDISEQCGYNIEEQVKLFHATKDLFKHKPILVVCNKVDSRPQTDLTVEEIQLIKSMESDVENIRFTYCSTLTGLNLDDAKNEACQMLTDLQKAKLILSGKTFVTNGGLDQLYVPQVEMSSERPAFIPPSVRRKKRTASTREADEMEEARLLEKDHQEMYGGAGVYDIDDRKHWDLENDEWIYDKLPEFYDGKNISDYIDQDIEEKVRQLEQEEAEMEATWNPAEQAPTEDWFVHQEMLKSLFLQSEKGRLRHSLAMKRNAPKRIHMPKTLEEIKARLESLGIDATGMVARLSGKVREIPDPDAKALSVVDEPVPKPVSENKPSRGRSTVPRGAADPETSSKSRSRSRRGPNVVNTNIAAENVEVELHARKKLRAMSLTRRRDEVGVRARSTSLARTPRGTLLNPASQRLAESMKLRADKRYRTPSKGAPKDQVHESDRFIGTKMPKHLFSGKRGIGKTDRR
eukprot:Blabericola_migrator_1__2992@NODE_1867_length_3627_cov_346_757865_g1195_i0_p1_GENE_NODE_1867_length_3627_cov_346_757865_g1195_i0NODE_1867_length_3627_cov_346_757865_g1195_i0_p1_ORF_typecomplete_len725_score144_69NOG1_N/PF17835_1/1_8e66NOG1/PF06858_14/1_7e03NOG1/PF06858_14/8_4e26FeoB_N/PF02421_18/4_5e26NOGCT/PF08155_11/1_5e20MMR_HSR1/PF01926_23/3_7e19GTP_EFTU/PF00009_27/2_3e07AIG1/PF04548_16/7_5e08Ras/PF00071_22/9_8e08Arf/PF00025_21/1_1e07SRPRB/PF09439_10/2_5e06RsgA_GTPase/PF03193_16/5_8e05RsgA_G